MRNWLAIIALVAILFMPSQAKAQSPVEFATLDINVWPEYDTTTVLVIYKISLASQVPLPAEVTLKLPASVAKISAVAVGNSADTVSDSGVDYQFTQGTDFATLTVKAAGRFLHVEYYDPSLVKDGNQHKFSFEWPGDNSVDNFRFELRQPLQSSNLVVTPALSAPLKDTDGFLVSDFSKAGLKIGEKMDFAIQYQRDTDSPSTSFMQVQSTTPLDQTLPGQSTWTTYLPWALGALGLALLFVAGWVYWSSSRISRARISSRRRHASRGVNNSDDGGQVYCSQCGKRAEPGDRFCRACGARIRQAGE